MTDLRFIYIYIFFNVTLILFIYCAVKVLCPAKEYCFFMVILSNNFIICSFKKNICLHGVYVCKVDFFQI